MRAIAAFLSGLTVRIDRIVNRILFVILFVMTAVTFAQVVSRYALGFSISWSEELCRFLFIWIIFLGVPPLILRSGMTAFDMLLRSLKGWKAVAAGCVVSGASFCFFWLMAVGSLPLVERQIPQIATSLPVSMGFVYGVIPLSGGLSLLFAAERLLRLFVPADGKAR